VGNSNNALMVQWGKTRPVLIRAILGPENSSKSHRGDAETLRASSENIEPSRLQGDWFSELEHRVATFSFVVRAKMEERHALSPFLSASPRLRGCFVLPVLG